MARLSSPLTEIRDRYTIVVVGSGYGGAIAASRLSRAGQTVCVLERGKEFQPGDFPDTDLMATNEFQMRTTERHIGARTGLYNFHVGRGISVLTGCGLGGGSLINANVSLRPDARVFDDQRWPPEIRSDLATRIADGFRHAEALLKPTPLPERYDLPKTRAHEKSAEALRRPFRRVPINVTFEDRTNEVGVPQRACTLCGDCVSGCNVGAKNTTPMNYLPDAVQHGAQIFTQVDVRRVQRQDGAWVVYYQPLATGQENFAAPCLFVRADIVILAAGTLGSTEILLRSQAAGMQLSQQLGHRFTGNGDVLGFACDTHQPIHGVGHGHVHPEGTEPVGPCITSLIDLNDPDALDESCVIEEGAIPGLLAPMLPLALGGAEAMGANDQQATTTHGVQHSFRTVQAMIRRTREHKLQHTQTYLLMGHDDCAGRLVLEEDALAIDWPHVGQHRRFERSNAHLRHATHPLGGRYVENPMWSRSMHDRLITVHPLGGCHMGVDAESGVVNHKGQVFAGASGTATHAGLYVADGAIIPRSVGVNPLLTISALAERTCALLAEDHGWTIDYALSSPGSEPGFAPGSTLGSAQDPLSPPSDPKAGLQFTERMTGWFSLHPEYDFQQGHDRGKAAGSSIEFTVTIRTYDVQKMLSDSAHQASMLGTVTAPALSARPLTILHGVFQLFVSDPSQVETRHMIYRMELSCDEGKRYFLSGYKVIRDRSPLSAWHDTTTLFTTIYEGDSERGALLGRGILHILPADLMRQLRTMSAPGATDIKERMRSLTDFGRFFAGVLVDSYGGLLASDSYFDPKSPMRKRRPLRTPAPEVYFIRTEDGVALRLTRYEGGKKGPVLLSHGLGVSSTMFAMDTLSTTPLEALCASGYDVWLFDWRGSIALQAAGTPFTCDDVARYDYPAALHAIVERTGRAQVDVICHCVGSITLFMAMLRGLPQVRSIVALQVATHPIGSTRNEVMAGLHLSGALQRLGVHSLTAYADKQGSWEQKLYDHAMSAVALGTAQGRCHSPVCHRTTFMYGSMFVHDNLDQQTHDCLHEIFGTANIQMFEHLMLCVRHGQILSATGEDIYLPQLDRLQLPITFIHGSENEVFAPRATEMTWQILCDRFGPAQYVRHEVPGYGHLDSLLGKNAARDVYPLLLRHLDKLNA